MMDLSFRFDVKAPSIPDQLRAQGYEFDSERYANSADELRRSLNQLQAVGALTERDSRRICVRLSRLYEQQIRPLDLLDGVEVSDGC